jgi:hypothetical protein
MSDFERDNFIDFGKYFLEEYSLTNIGAKYTVWDYKDRILIRKSGDPKKINEIPFYTIGVLI